MHIHIYLYVCKYVYIYTYTYIYTYICIYIYACLHVVMKLSFISYDCDYSGLRTGSNFLTTTIYHCFFRCSSFSHWARTSRGYRPATPRPRGAWPPVLHAASGLSGFAGCALQCRLSGLHARRTFHDRNGSVHERQVGGYAFTIVAFTGYSIVKARLPTLCHRT